MESGLEFMSPDTPPTAFSTMMWVTPYLHVGFDGVACVRERMKKEGTPFLMVLKTSLVYLV